MKEYFHPLQHTEMFKRGMISVFCESKDASDRLRLHLRNSGYIKWCCGDITTVDRWREGGYYCTLLNSIGQCILCMDYSDCAGYTLYYK